MHGFNSFMAGFYHIDTRQWTGFIMIGTSAMKELRFWEYLIQIIFNDLDKREQFL